jgi:hypothetical protein
VDVIPPALQHAKQQLFEPFRLGQWARLAVVGLLAGEMSSGGCNWGAPFDLANSGRDELVAQTLPAFNPALTVALITLLVICLVAVWLILLYVNSRMRFVLFDSVVTKYCRIRSFWKDRREVGFRYFVWQVGFSLATLASVAIIIGIPILLAFRLGLLESPRENLLPLVFVGVNVALIAAGVLISAGIVHVLTKDFVVPQMACEGVGAIEGWRRLWPMLKDDKVGYAVYVVLKLVLAIVAAIVFLIIMLFILLFLLIPVGGAGAVAVLAARAAGVTWNIFTIAIAVVAAIVGLAAMFFVAALVSVPAIVFFPAYSMYFFAARYDPLDSLLKAPVAAPS